MRNLKNTKGITLIALVVTIVVLLILAAVSISMLGGENGIITQAIKSQDETEQAKVQEIVDLAVNTLISENMGSKDGITPKDIADKINEEYSQYENVHAEDEANFPTKIIFPEEGDREVEVDLGTSTGNIDNMYDVDVSEEDIAPSDLFLYEKIDSSGIASLRNDSTQMQELKIIALNPKYCNSGGYYNSETEETYDDTNYEIKYNGKDLKNDTLIIPGMVEYNGEICKVVEVELTLLWKDNDKQGKTYPINIKKIIYPNTVRKISAGDTIMGENYPYISVHNVMNNIEEIILPSSLEEIGSEVFFNFEKLKNIKIADNILYIGNLAFYNTLWDNNLSNGEIYIGKVFYKYSGEMPQETSIKIKEGTTSIASDAFSWYDSLISIEIPSTVTSIGFRAFGYTGLTRIEIPSSVGSIEKSTFYGCSSLTSIKIPSNVTNIGYDAFYECSSLTTVNYTGTMAQWKQISIDYGNDYLKNAQIICTDGTINQ